uniref:AlNc14C44G3629 protein n=1 Tax=Albugo laibachii Nc14 TaxID=890382 RepID=F0WAA0_9STRA|nr:AlNc14C44G3629 [Albugo laibachii Nc14]|eukprot:CCA18070.1 AlNc14C44G3629 [Albugo laibachii Nc14]
MMSQRKNTWMTAVSEEFKDLEEIGTKTDANGDVERYKARLVAYGNEQFFGHSQADTGLMTKMERAGTSWKWAGCICQSGKGTAFGRLHEGSKRDQDNEMDLKRYGVKDSSKLELLLKKALYGLKQAGRLRRKLLHSRLCEAGFTQCTTSRCPYLNEDKVELTIVGVYVYDLLVTETSRDAVDKFFKGMSALDMKDLGVVNKFLVFEFRWMGKLDTF